MDRYDVVIIGGGIHGVGVAQAAAASGHSVLLLEKTDLACATSSQSTKLIHGGLRYLESAKFSLVYESLQERDLLTRIAPDLVRLEKFHIPIYQSTSRSRMILRLGLSLYALLGGLRPSTRFHVLDKKQWDTLDGLKQDKLKAVYQYHDGRVDDVALTRAVMHSATELDAELAVPAEFTSADCESDKVHVSYKEGGVEIHCTASVLVNATGAWVNQLLKKITPEKSVMNIDLVQGTHLLLNDMPVKHCFYLEAPQDKRAVFVLPWKNKTLLGTTETSFTGQPDDVQPQQHEKDYLLDVVRHYFPENKTFNVAGSFSGLRVLPSGKGSHFRKPRESVLYRSHPRVINIYGGKLTTYRLVAKRVIEKLREVLPSRKVIALTENIELKG